jgi:glycerol-3-phosphate acyltransferase PlsY
MPSCGKVGQVTVFSGKEWSVILCSYLLGCCTAGYYWMRFRTGLDIRRLGSGNAGARNVGRSLGAGGFAVTFILDFLKGILAVWVANWMGLSPEAVIATMVAVVVGHAWPIQLRFQGGKGISTAFGAIICYNPSLALVLISIFVPLLLLIRIFTLSGMLAFALCPLVAFLCGFTNPQVAAISFLSILVLITHRKNIREEVGRLIPQKATRDISSNKEDPDHER